MAHIGKWTLVSIIVGIGGIVACSSHSSSGESGNLSQLGPDARDAKVGAEDAAQDATGDATGGACGGPGQSCCASADAGKGQCDPGALCISASNVCVACGKRDQMCCGSDYHSADGYCTEPGMACDLEGMFQCKPPRDLCGGIGQKCCPSGVADHPCDDIWANCGGGAGPRGICKGCGGNGTVECCRPQYGSQAPSNCMDGSSCKPSGMCS